jgi:hypothetical protein
MVEVARFKTKTTGWAGSPGWTTHHYTRSGVVAWASHAPNIIANIQSALADIASLLPSSMLLETLGTYDVIESTTGEILYSGEVGPSSQNGTGTDEYGPLATGLCVTWRTAGVVAGKHVRGRTFIVPVHAGVQEANGSPSGAALALMATYALNMLSTPTNTQFVTLARPKILPGPPPVVERAGSTHIITSATVKDTFAILRSRRD